MGIGMGQELVKEGIGRVQINHVFCGKESWQSALVIVMAALDFALSLRSWSVAQSDAVEMQGSA